MNCANHPDRQRAAFCQNCGKPVCDECVHNVAGSVFCEPCLTARVGATAPPGGFPYPGFPYPGNPQPGPVNYPPARPPVVADEPSPGLAALLGFIPGVGAMYNGQYAKGIAHLVVFVLLFALANENDSLVFFLFGWEFYMAIEAHHTACARRDGTPLPNPFGLNDLLERLGFGKTWPVGAPNTAPTEATQGFPPAGPAADVRPPVGGADTCFYQAADGSQTCSVPGAPPAAPVPPYADVNVPSYRRFPSGAIWLIVLGVFFLAGDSGFFHIFHRPVFWPVFLIAVGVWVFMHKMITTGHGLENDGTESYRSRLTCAVRGPFWIILLGAIWLLHSLGILSWGRSWPLLLIAWGVMLLFRRTRYGGYGFAGNGYGGYGASPGQSGSAPAAVPVSGSEAMPSEPAHGPSGSDSGNGQHDDPQGR